MWWSNAVEDVRQNTPSTALPSFLAANPQREAELQCSDEATDRDRVPCLACRAKADHCENRGESGWSGKWWHTVADRIAAGYMR